MTEQPNREVAVLNAALELPAGQRAAYLDEACAGDAALRERVEDLLQAHEQAGDFLGSAPAGLDFKITGSVSTPLREKPGDRIGRYKLLEQIGEGGCGVVYVAEQEEPVRRRVAVKVIKLGMETEQVIARFEAERQALALMDHPNIAKVLDAGATETGRPFFVMELVRGVPMTQYCDQNTLSTEERLKLFIQVCQAVQHAHQKGIIHRDIKPSNILVTINDGVPVPKVIDFGIAKATQGRLTDRTIYTAFDQFMGTPAYMSPEQAVMTSLDVDTRTDIYSLGVLLYELLTGKTPFDAKELLEAGLDAMRRTIQEKEPAKPSTRLSTMVEGELTTTAKHRHTDAPKLIHVIRGDLDWIVMKCLEKDRTRRYETANGLAMDIHRHLSTEPIVARPPSVLYRFEKSVQRNKLAFTAAALVIAALVAGLSVSAWEFFKEKAARRQAQTEAVKSRQVARFLKDMLEGAGPSAALGRDTSMLREILDRTAERIGKDLTNQPEVEAELRATLAGTYDDLALHEQAEQMARDSLRVARSRIGEDNLYVASALVRLGEILRHRGKLPEAESATRDGLAIQTKLLPKEHPDLATTLLDLGLVFREQGRLVEAEAKLREALALQRKLFGNEHPTVAYSLNMLGATVRDEGRLPDAEIMLRESLAMQRKLLGNEHPDVAGSLDTLAGLLYTQGKLAEAETMAREALTLQGHLFGDDHPQVANSLNTLADVLSAEGKLPEAETFLREALRIWKKRFGSEHPDIANSLNSLAMVLAGQDKMVEAETALREALAMQKKLLGNEHPDVANTLNSLAAVLGGQGKFAAAETVEREALDMQKKVLGNEHADVANSLNTLANLLGQQGKMAESESMLREALAIRRKLLGSEHPEIVLALSNLAFVLRQEGKLAEAETLQREALTIQRKKLGNGQPYQPTALDNLFIAFTQLTNTLIVEKNFTEAERLAREFLTFAEKETPDDWRMFRARVLLGGSLAGEKRFAEAEPLLISGYEGMKQREAQILAVDKSHLKRSLEQIVQFYETTGRHDKAAEWKHKSAEFDKPLGD